MAVPGGYVVHWDCVSVRFGRAASKAPYVELLPESWTENSVFDFRGAVISRIRLDPKTQTYVAKKTAEGHSKMEIIRCLKRYLAREVYFVLNPGRQHIVPNTRRHGKAA